MGGADACHKHWDSSVTGHTGELSKFLLRGRLWDFRSW